jgi:AAA domain
VSGSEIGTDNARRRLVGPLQEVKQKVDGNILLTMLPEPSEYARPHQGTFRLVDQGTDAVLNSEESVFRELEFALSTGEEVPAGRAWRFLQPIFGDDGPRHRSSKNLWCGEIRQVSKGESESSSIIAGRLLQALRSGNNPDALWHIITGSPGTGKTHVTASLAFQFLEAISERLFPPGRVLVVAATHFAVDNFVRVFRKEFANRYVPYRFVPHKREKALKNRNITPLL